MGPAGGIGYEPYRCPFLLRPDLDYEKPAPYLIRSAIPMDEDGNVILPMEPSLGMEPLLLFFRFVAAQAR